jgi:hydroxymethylglutaryl-CoA lyase
VIGFPLSVSETFQLRNVNKTIEESWEELSEMQAVCTQHNKRLQVYLSMGFGNPYNDPYSPELVAAMADRLVNHLGITDIAPSDTLGSSEPYGITNLFSMLTGAFPEVRFSAHLHSTQLTAPDKINAALIGGCRHFDSAFLGFGGCPMANDDLVGNIPTEILMGILQPFLPAEEQKYKLPHLNIDAYHAALSDAEVIFAPYRLH